TDPDESPLPLYREVDDSEAWLPDRHKNGHVPGPLPLSIRTAMRSFVLTRAARMARGETRAHNSMLIHVTRFTSVQDAVRLQVADELELLKSRIKFGDGNGPSVRGELKELWDRDFAPTTAAMPADDQPPLLWSQIEPLLTSAVDPIVVKTINGTAKDALDYFEQRASGLNVIAIGGDKLSRGLTLDGLSVSYYLRASKAFDTLLQMGRWFGYRPGYEDLCRLWTSDRLWNAYRQVSVANEELIGEFEEMASRHLTPSEYGLKVQNSVEGMLVTAANKMRAGTGLRVGFAGAISETTVLLADAVTAKSNLGVVDRFVVELSGNYGSTEDSNKNIVWHGVPGDMIADRFFAPFITADSAYKVNAQTIARYVRDRLQHGELTDWTVALMSNPGSPTTIGGHPIELTTRRLLDDNGAVDTLRTTGVYRIRRILSPSDETIDFSSAEMSELLEASREAYRKDPGRRRSEPKIPSGPVIRHARPAERGLLLIYPLTPPAQDDREAAAKLGKNLTDEPLVGFAVSFPASPDAPAMDYVVNQRFLDELFGVGDDDDEE
ncbi:MAG: endonuclease, partial [Dehalococcoidia bacterium]